MVLTEEQKMPDDKTQRVPAMQRLLDDPFLLLFIAVAVPTIMFSMWGIMEIITIPLAK